MNKGKLHKDRVLDHMTEQNQFIFDEDYPFVLTIECIFETEDKLYLVQQYVRSEPLSK